MTDPENRISFNNDDPERDSTVPDNPESPLRRMLREKGIPYERYDEPIDNGQVIAETVLARLGFSREEIDIALERTPDEINKRKRRIGGQTVHRRRNK